MKKPHFIAAGVLAVGVILVIYGLTNRTPHEPAPPALIIRYEPSVCSDAWNKPDINKSAFTGTNFVVELHEGCFHEVLIMPKSPQWREWHFHVEREGQADCWYALWPTGRQKDTGVIRCNANAPPVSLNDASVMRLQGQEGLHVRFYTSAWQAQ